MFISKGNLIIVLILSAILRQHHQTYASITIQIEPDEFQYIGDILMQTYMQQQPKTLSTIGIKIKSFSKAAFRGTLQMIGIMMTLVGANLLTTKLEPFVRQSELSAKNITAINPSEMCKYDYGCDDNLCWRTCDGAEENSLSWCYTTLKQKEPEFQSCKYSHECSPCWACLSDCKATIKN